MADEKPTPSTPSSQRRWRDASTTAIGKARAARGRRVFHLLIVLMAVLGIFVGWLLFWNPVDPPRFLSFPITQYKMEYWPVNAWAGQDGEALAGLLDTKRKGSAHDKKVYFQAQSRAPLRRQLQGLAEHANPDQAVVIHLSALARTDGAEVYLLPADAEAGLGNKDSWISLNQVVKWLRDCKAKKKLLLLDLMRPNADARLGNLANDSAERVQAVLAGQDLDFAVIGACSGGQVSLASEELGQSVFGYYLVEGLRGWADVYTQKDDRVTVGELAQFVNVRVGRWALQRELQQSPFYIPLKENGKEKDFILARAERGPRSASVQAYSDRLKTGWQKWQVEMDSKHFRNVPLGLKRLEEGVLRAEKRWRSGMGHPQREIDDRIESLDAQEKAAEIRNVPTHSLAMSGNEKKLESDHTKKVEAMQKMLEKALRNSAANVAAASPDPKKPEKEPSEPKKEFSEQFKDANEVDLARAVWEVASADDAEGQPGRRAALLADWYESWSKNAKSAAVPVVEMLYLKQLAALKSAAAISAPTIRKVLRTASWAEKVAADARILPFFQPLLESAGKMRDAAERALWTEPAAAHSANAVAEAFREFRDLEASAEKLRSALLARDEALVRLPPYACYLLKRLEFETVVGRLDSWLAAVSLVDTLEADLASLKEQPSGTSDRFERISKRGKDLQRLLNELQQVLFWKTILELGSDSPASLKEWDALLELPWWKISIPAKVSDDEKRALEMRYGISVPDKPKPNEVVAFDREMLWQKRQQIARKLNREKVWALDEAENRAGKKTPEPVIGNRESALLAEKKRAHVRAQISVALLRLGGYFDAERLDQQRKKFADGREGSFPIELYQAWQQGLEKEVARLLKAKEFAKADRLSRVIPLWIAAPWEVDKVNKTPSAEQRRQELRQFCKWHAEACRKRSGVLQGTVFKDFYDAAARKYEESRQ